MTARERRRASMKRPACSLSVYASATHGPEGALTVDRAVTGRLAVEDAVPGVALGRALAAAALPHADFDADTGARASLAGCSLACKHALTLTPLTPMAVARLHACLARPWTPLAAALPHMDAAWVVSDGTYTVHAGTLAHTHGALRLPLAVPCVAVSGGGLSLQAHATERTPGAADDALFFTPFAFLCAPAADGQPARVVELPARSFCSQAPAHMLRTAAHRLKRIQTKEQHVQALHSLALHETDTHTDMRVLADGTVLCQTDFANPVSSMISFHMPNV